MSPTDENLNNPATNAEGERTISRHDAITATRAQLDDGIEASDDEVWAAWERLGGGPTNRDDLLRVVAQFEGIAVDG